MSTQIKIDAHLEGPIATWVVTKPDGQQIRQKTRIDQFIHMLHEANDSPKYRRIGKLPSGLYDFAIGESQGTFKAVITVPAGIRTFLYFGEAFMIPFPETVFLLTSVNSKITETKVFSRNSDSICHYPFGNVYPDGRICWGRNTLPAIHTIADMQKIPSLFYGADTNDDLYSAGKNVTRCDDFIYQRGLIRKLENESVFPAEWLVPCHQKLSFTDLTNNFFD